MYCDQTSLNHFMQILENYFFSGVWKFRNFTVILYFLFFYRDITQDESLILESIMEGLIREICVSPLPDVYLSVK